MLPSYPTKHGTIRDLLPLSLGDPLIPGLLVGVSCTGFHLANILKYILPLQCFSYWSYRGEHVLTVRVSLAGESTSLHKQVKNMVQARFLQAIADG